MARKQTCPARQNRLSKLVYAGYAKLARQGRLGITRKFGAGDQAR